MLDHIFCNFLHLLDMSPRTFPDNLLREESLALFPPGAIIAPPPPLLPPLLLKMPRE